MLLQYGMLPQQYGMWPQQCCYDMVCVLSNVVTIWYVSSAMLLMLKPSTKVSLLSGKADF